MRQATADLLLEVGYADLSVAAIAERAGTSRPAIYRRWPGLAHLVHETVFDAEVADRAPGTGTFAGDLHQLVRQTAELLTTPLARIAVPGLIAEAAADPVLHQRLLDRFVADGWGGLEAYLVAAAAAGDLVEHVDAAALLELVIGSALAAILMRGADGLDETWVGATTKTLLDGIRPRTS